MLRSYLLPNIADEDATIMMESSAFDFLAAIACFTYVSNGFEKTLQLTNTILDESAKKGEDIAMVEKRIHHKVYYFEFLKPPFDFIIGNYKKVKTFFDVDFIAYITSTKAKVETWLAEIVPKIDQVIPVSRVVVAGPTVAPARGRAAANADIGLSSVSTNARPAAMGGTRNNRVRRNRRKTFKK